MPKSDTQRAKDAAISSYGKTLRDTRKSIAFDDLLQRSQMQALILGEMLQQTLL